MDNKKRQYQATIIKNQPIAPDIFEMVLEAPEASEAATPGQFVNLYTGEGGMLLPRPLGIADAADGQLTLVYGRVGKGTARFSKMKINHKITMLGPNGTGFNLALPDAPGGQTIRYGAATGREGAIRPAIYLVGGGLGIPPLLFAARRLRIRNAHPSTEQRMQATHADAATADVEDSSVAPLSASIIAILGYGDEPWYTEQMKAFCHQVYAISETTGACRGNVLDLLSTLHGASPSDASSFSSRGLPIAASPNPISILSCGPRPMLKALTHWAAERAVPIQVSMEERMGCGIGVCVGCTCRLRDERGMETSEKVCTAGPVFNGRTIQW